MMRHVLVSKGFWNIVQGIDVLPGSVDFVTIDDVTAPSTSSTVAVLSTVELVRWNGYKCTGTCLDCVICQTYHYPTHSFSRLGIFLHIFMQEAMRHMLPISKNR